MGRAEMIFLVGEMVPGVGLEPTWPCSQGILSPQRLPFRHPGKVWDC